MKKHRRKAKPAVQAQEWSPFVLADHVLDGTGARLPVPEGLVIVFNNRYQVLIRRVPPAEPFGEMLWLSIHRNDREAVHDWRELQRIKNEVVGVEFEAVELYPAESRLVDTSNEYHLFVFLSGYRMPFGYQERLLLAGKSAHPLLSRAKQRPWPKGAEPPDVKTPEEAEERLPKGDNDGDD